VTGFKNPMEVFMLLEKSNCRQCNAPTCLAFAAAVFQGQRELKECPRLSAEVIARFEAPAVPRPTADREGDDQVRRLQEKIAGIDLKAAARRLGARYEGGRLVVKVLGKDFRVDPKGGLSSDIHIHSWVAVPVLSYVVAGSGALPAGKWVPLRELPGGKDWYRLFAQRCEKPIKRVADIYPDLFEDMIVLFNGRPVQNHYDADISLVLHPLPRVPLLICYTKPEDVFESDLNLFFDATVEENMNIESIFALGTGLARMFEKIALRHGFR